jgi:hypothetical protein
MYTGGRDTFVGTPFQLTFRLRIPFDLEPAIGSTPIRIALGP